MAVSASYQSPPYLTPFNVDGVKIPEATLHALQQIEQMFYIDNERLHAVVEKFLWEFKKGLAEEPTTANKDAFLPMIPTYVQHIPTGTEEGTFLALDLGGTNLRVCEVSLHGKGKFTMRQQKYKVSETLKKGDVTALFDYIALSVDMFLTEIGTQVKEPETLFLGFTFSFPVLQTSIDSGTLLGWTKGFECRNAIGKDVVQLLQDALDRKHIHVTCSALVNDTAGALMSNAYQTGDSLVGAIFGTGTNGAYVEDVAKITKMHCESVDGGKKGLDLDKAKDSGLEKMIINTEWGAFDNERKILKYTLFDSRVDRISINPRKQAFEKMISGMYLGEVTRNVILHLVDSQVLFDGYSSNDLNIHYGLDTAIMSALEGAFLSGDDPIRQIRQTILNDLKIPEEHVSDADCLVVARVSEIVGSRGCRLSACALAAVVKQTGNDQSEAKVMLGADGSLVEFYPKFKERVLSAMTEVLGEAVTKRCTIGLAKDGSGVGAALCAAAAKKQQEAGL